MNCLKTIGISIINAVILITAFIFIGNILHNVTGHYADHVNFTSVMTSVICIGIFAGIALLESKKLHLSIWGVLSASLIIIAVGGIGIAIAVSIIAGGIG